MVASIDITTDRLLLRRFRATDVDDVLAYRDDDEFRRYLPRVPAPFTRRDAEEYIATTMNEPWDLHPTFAVVRGQKVIGTVSFDVQPWERIAMLWFAIGREHWGQGIAGEAASAAIAWAFDASRLAKIWASTDARNERSQRLLEKLGMRLEGRLRAHHLARDGRTDELQFGLLREEWLARFNDRPAPPDGAR